MANPETRTYTPEMFIAGELRIVAEIAAVKANETIAKHAPVKIGADGKVENVDYVAASSAADYAAATAAVHTLVIGAAFTAGDTITINGVVYTCVASDATGNQFVAGTAAQVASALKTLLANDLVFTVASSSANVTFTQKVATIGDIPTVSTTVSSGASITTTTAAVAGTNPAPMKTAAENTAANLYGIAAEASKNGFVEVLLTGEYFGDALKLENNVTLDMLKPAFRNIGIFLK